VGNERRTIALLGGSFDPPHAVHLQISVYVLQVTEAAEVWWIPCASHAFGKQSAPLADRVRLCELATRHAARVRVCDIEAELPHPSFTIDTLEALRREHPDTRFVWIVGSDLLDELPRWHRWSELAETLPFVVVQRGREMPPLPAQGRFLKLPVRFHDVSSSEVRAALAGGEDAGGWLDRRVAEQIRTLGCYRS